MNNNSIQTKTQMYSSVCLKRIDFLLLMTMLAVSYMTLVVGYYSDEYAGYMSVVKYPILLYLYISLYRSNAQSNLLILYVVFVFLYSAFSPYTYSYSRLFISTSLFLTFYIYRIVFLSTTQKKHILYFFVMAMILFYFLPNKDVINGNRIGFMYVVLFLNIFTTLLSLRIFSAYYFVTFLLCLIFSCAGILEVSSRTSLVVLIIIIIIPFFIKKYKHVNIFFIYICILGIAFPVLYTNLADNPSIANDISFSDVGGKKVFSGREIVYRETLRELSDIKHLLFGGVELFWWEKSYHSSFLDIIADFGIILMIVIISLFSYYLKKIKENISLDDFVIVYTVCMSLIWGFAESGWFLGISSIVLFPFLLVREKIDISFKQRKK